MDSRDRFEYARELGLIVQELSSADDAPERDQTPSLIERLGDTDAGVRSVALASLRSISGTRLEAQAELWGDWWSAESERYRARFQALAEQVRGAQASEISAALRELARVTG